MPVSWRSEACGLGTEPHSGAFITRYTQAAKHSINIYGEQPYTSPDGKRIAIMRAPEADPRFAVHDLFVADLTTCRIEQAAADVHSLFIATAAWSGMIYYLSATKQLMRLDISTLENKVVFDNWPLAEEFMLQSVSPDHRYLVGALPQASYETAFVQVDLQQQTWKVLLEAPELFGSHLQYMPTAPDAPFQIMGLEIRGQKYNDKWDKKTYPTEHPGTGYYVVDNDGGNLRKVPSGPPVMNGNNGHSAWVGDTGRICFSTNWDFDTWEMDPRYPEGNLFTAAGGDEKAVMFSAPEYRFNHVSVSKCGRYFVCDSFPQGLPLGPCSLVIGNFATGKYRPIVTDCGATGGGPACSHAHPYITADNKHVIYTSSPYLIGQVYSARIPDEFWASLD